MEGGRLQLTQEIILFIITTVITAVLGVIGYFLKRTMDRNDKNEAAVQELRDNLLTLSDKYATKAEIREIKASMEKLSENIDYIKEHTTKMRILSELWQDWKAKSTITAADRRRNDGTDRNAAADAAKNIFQE